MAKIGIFYGSTTGNTEMIAQEIQKILGEDLVDLYDVESVNKNKLNDYEFLIFGIPTWDIGELQEDWEDWIDNLKHPDINLKGKKTSIFGVGDQEGYPDTFGDAIKAIHDILVDKDAIVVCDKWPMDNYNFENSLVVKDGYLLGLMIDEDSQSELTDGRIKLYTKELKKHFKI